MFFGLCSAVIIAVVVVTIVAGSRNVTVSILNSVAPVAVIYYPSQRQYYIYMCVYVYVCVCVCVCMCVCVPACMSTCGCVHD